MDCSKPFQERLVYNYNKFRAISLLKSTFYEAPVHSRSTKKPSSSTNCTFSECLQAVTVPLQRRPGVGIFQQAQVSKPTNTMWNKHASILLLDASGLFFRKSNTTVCFWAHCLEWWRNSPFARLYWKPSRTNKQKTTQQCMCVHETAHVWLRERTTFDCAEMIPCFNPATLWDILWCAPLLLCVSEW